MKKHIQNIIIFLTLLVGTHGFAQSEQSEELLLNWELYFFDIFSEPKPENNTQLYEVAACMRTYPQEFYLAVGHTDGQGSELYNRKLSEVRARYMKQLLHDFLREEDRVKIVHVGLSFLSPQIPHAQTEAEHSWNRRVSIQTYSPNYYHGKCAAWVEYAILKAFLPSMADFDPYCDAYEDLLFVEHLSDEEYDEIALKLRRAREDVMKGR